MEMVYAALLLHSSDQEVNEENVEGVLEGAGIEYDSSQVKALIAALEDVDLEEAMSKSVSMGAAPAAPSGEQEAASEEEPGEEEEEEEAAPEDEGASEEEAAEGLGSLF